MSLFLLPTFPSLGRRDSNNHHTTKRSFSRPFLQASCVHKQFTNRRTALVGLGLITSLITNPDLSMANGGASELQILPEFGSEPRQLDKVIRVIVPRSKSGANGETVEVVMVEDIEIPNSDSVKFDVYVAKPGSDDLGELAGSLVQDSRLRTGRNYRKSGLNLGITNLVRRIGCERCEELVVSLVPRSGELSIGGIRIDLFNNH